MRLGILLLIISLFVCTIPAEALFRKPAPVSAPAPHYKPERSAQRKKIRIPTPLQRSNSSSESYASLVGLIAAAVCLIAFAATGMGLFLIPMFAFAAFAVVMGAFGIHRMKRGYALAGLIGGFVCIVGGFIALATL